MITITTTAKTGFFNPPPEVFRLLTGYDTFPEWWPEDMDVRIPKAGAARFQFRAGLLQFHGQETIASSPEEITWDFGSANFTGRWKWQIHPGDGGSAVHLNISGKVTGVMQVLLSPFMFYERRIISASRRIFRAMRTQLTSQPNFG